MSSPARRIRGFSSLFLLPLVSFLENNTVLKSFPQVIVNLVPRPQKPKCCHLNARVKEDLQLFTPFYSHQSPQGLQRDFEPRGPDDHALAPTSVIHSLSRALYVPLSEIISPSGPMPVKFSHGHWLPREGRRPASWQTLPV